MKKLVLTRRIALLWIHVDEVWNKYKISLLLIRMSTAMVVLLKKEWSRFKTATCTLGIGAADRKTNQTNAKSLLTTSLYYFLPDKND